jgi:hypothetical protein
VHPECSITLLSDGTLRECSYVAPPPGLGAADRPAAFDRRTAEACGEFIPPRAADEFPEVDPEARYVRVTPLSRGRHAREFVNLKMDHLG